MSFILKCTTGYYTTDDSSLSEIPEAIVGFGDAALDCKTWTGLVSEFLLKFEFNVRFCMFFGLLTFCKLLRDCYF